MLAFGGAMMMVSTAMAEMADELARMFKEIANSGDAFKSLGQLAMALAGVGTVGLVVRLAAMALGLSEMAAAVNSMFADRLNPLAEFTTALSAIEEVPAELKVEKVLKHVNDMTPAATSRLQQLGNIMAPPAAAATTAATPAPVVNMSPTFKVIVEMPDLGAEI